MQSNNTLNEITKIYRIMTELVIPMQRKLYVYAIEIKESKKSQDLINNRNQKIGYNLLMAKNKSMCYRYNRNRVYKENKQVGKQVNMNRGYKGSKRDN